MADVITADFTTTRRDPLTQLQVGFLRRKYGKEPKLGTDYCAGIPYSYHGADICWRKDALGQTVSYSVTRHLFITWEDGTTLSVPLGRLRDSEVDRHFPDDSYYLGLFLE